MNRYSPPLRVPSGEELTKLADELFVMYDKGEQQDGRSANDAEKP